jgi:hypothetical protein
MTFAFAGLKLRKLRTSRGRSIDGAALYVLNGMIGSTVLARVAYADVA